MTRQKIQTHDQRMLCEDALKHLFDCRVRKVSATRESVAGSLNVSVGEATAVLSVLREAKLIEADHNTWSLTTEGKEYALQVIRAHRLYETYLANETSIEEVRWHAHADEMEHRMSEREVDQLADRLGHPRYDPHGDPIPTKDGHLPEQEGDMLANCKVGFTGRVKHIEDEPASLYREITHHGMAAGMFFKILETERGQWLLNLEGRTVHLSHAAAQNIRVRALREDEVFVPSKRRLSDLKPGEEAILRGLSPACRGSERRRLLDMGFIDGGTVKRELSGAFSSPIAYRVRGTLVGLRTEQAERIYIS